MLFLSPKAQQRTGLRGGPFPVVLRARHHTPPRPRLQTLELHVDLSADRLHLPERPHLLRIDFRPSLLAFLQIES